MCIKQTFKMIHHLRYESDITGPLLSLIAPNDVCQLFPSFQCIFHVLHAHHVFYFLSHFGVLTGLFPKIIHGIEFPRNCLSSRKPGLSGALQLFVYFFLQVE